MSTLRKDGKKKGYLATATKNLNKSLNLSRSKLAKSAQKARMDHQKILNQTVHDIYDDTPKLKLRPNNPTKHIHKKPIYFHPKTENERVREVIKNHHPMTRENFDIEGYHYY